ncbi:transposable element Tcb1 transposase [Trichonephila clavipes]|nr:transposable element Tcb1 transposase [Trichonephila clavipes]
MVWGCMSSQGVGRLHIVSGTVKSMDYIEILQNKLLPTVRDLFGNQSWIFQDDNAPCHRAKVVQKWLKNHTVNRMNWPGQSPDLNPIENLWFKIGYEISNKEQKRYPAVLSRRESISGQSTISFPRDTSMSYLGFEPTRLQAEFHNHQCRWDGYINDTE